MITTGALGVCGYTRRRSSARAGMVLILVLIALVIMVSGLTLWMQTVGVVQRDGIATINQRVQVDLLQSGERLARDWILTHGSRAVAPENGGGWTVARDRVHGSMGDAELQVTVFDGWAGLPLPLLHVRGSLRRNLPPIFASLPIPVITVPDEEKFLGPQDFIETAMLPLGLKRFPDEASHGGDMLQWGTSAAAGGKVFDVASTSPGAGGGMPLALVISPHSSGAINLNTAPIRLVETVCRLRGIGVPEHLRAQRRAGVLSLVPAGADQVDARLPRLVDHSLVWNCLISVRWAGRMRSWWVVMVGSATNLRIVQRHDASS